MSEAEFWSSSLRAIFFRINAARKLELESWRRVRWQTSVLFNIQLPLKDRQTPMQMLPLPGDEEKPAAAPQATPHEYAKFLIDQYNR